MKQAVQHLVRQIISMLLLGALALLLCCALLLDRTPILTAQGKLNAEAMRHSQQLLANLNQSMRDPLQEQWVIETNLEELNAAFAVASRTLPGFQGKAHIQQNLTILLTMPVQWLGLKAYLNANIQIQPSTGPLQISKVQIGMLTLPGNMALSLLEKVADQLWGAGQGADLLAKVRSVQFQKNAVKLELTKPAGFGLSELKQSGLTLYKQLFSSPEQRADIEFYYTLASEHAQHNPSASLVDYLQLLFRQAQVRSAIDADLPERAQRENQAVILAMAQLLGGNNLQLLVNEIKRPIGVKAPKVTLARRPDLQQHFIYSATLHLLANKKLSSTVGEAKELMDSLKGGSGFSFVDLLADRAGIRFATIATVSPASAQAVQQFFMQQPRTEAEIFPSKSRLPEGLTQQMFESQYQSIDSKLYLQLVADIDQRLNALPFYQIQP